MLMLLALFIASISTMASAAVVTKTYAYVTDYGSNTTTVIDTATDTVVATIATGKAPVGVAVSPDGKEVYVVNSGSNSVSIIDTYTGAKKGDISVGSSPQHVAFAPDGKRAYVTGSNGVAVIDTLTHGVQHITNNSLNNAMFIAVSPDGKTACVTNFQGGRLTFIDLQTNKIAGSINYMGVNANVAGEVVFSKDGKTAYMAMIAHATYPGDISVVNMTTRKEAYNFSLGPSTEKWGMKLGPKDGLLYVTDTQNNQVLVTGTYPLRVHGGFLDFIIPVADAASGPEKIAAGSDPWALAFTPDGSKLYAGCLDSVTVIDPVAKVATGSILIPGTHHGIAIAAVSVPAPDVTATPTVAPTGTPTQAQPTEAAATPTAVPTPGANETATPTPTPGAGSENALLYVICGCGAALVALTAGRKQGGK